MNKYYFYDTDPTGCGFEDYDIAGEDYVELISTCCKYSAYLSLRITDNEDPVVKELEKYIVEKNENIIYMYDHFYSEDSDQCRSEVKYYRVCPELCELLLNITDSIFKWIDGWGYHNPNDPVFYRSDGSVFFSSIIHEGECIWAPREGEDVSCVVSKEHWLTERVRRS